jgi:hypothetical protein
MKVEGINPTPWYTRLFSRVFSKSCAEAQRNFAIWRMDGCLPVTRVTEFWTGDGAHLQQIGY